jgi:hypothetical protein
MSLIYSFVRVLWYPVFALDFIFILQDRVAHRFSLLSAKSLFYLSIIRRPVVPPRLLTKFGVKFLQAYSSPLGLLNLLGDPTLSSKIK